MSSSRSNGDDSKRGISVSSDGVSSNRSNNDVVS